MISEVDEVEKEELKRKLDEWYLVMRDRQREKATEMKTEIDQLMWETDDPILRTTHKLFQIKYYLLHNDIRKVSTLFSEIGMVNFFPDDKRLKYYYHFLNGNLMYKAKYYREAVENYLRAEDYIEEPFEDLERAELKYKLGVAYYYFNYIGFSMEVASEALNIFLRKNKYKRAADCENLIGENYLFMRQYEQAERHFQCAVKHAKSADNKGTLSTIYNNIGYLYSGKDLSASAISYLLKAQELMHSKNKDRIRGAYLLTKEYFKSNEDEKACEFLKTGLNLVSEWEDEEYSHHFGILQAKYIPENDRLEEIYKIGLDFFAGREMWDFVIEYSEEFAGYYRDQEQYEDSVRYYDLAIQAREKLDKKGVFFS